MDITELLAFSVKQGSSDLHLSAGLPPMIRIDGDMRRVNLPPMEHKEVHGLVYEIMNDKQRRDYEEFLETDFSFEVPGVARFRVNAFNQNSGGIQNHSFSSIDVRRAGLRSNIQGFIHVAERLGLGHGADRFW